MDYTERLTRLEIARLPDGVYRFRGGLSLMRDFEFVGAEPAQLQMRADRRVTRPYGLAGGQAGSPSCNLMAPGTKKERELPAMVTTTIAPGETVRFMTAGGGGWGDPRERDPQAVAEDVADGKMTPAHARAVWYRRRCGARDSAAQERFAPESGRGR